MLVDNVENGAANPWGLAWSADSKTVVITHAGTHEISVIDFPALLAKLARLPKTLEEGKNVEYTAASRVPADVRNDLSFLVGVRQRIRFAETDRGPRAVLLVGAKAYVANYFSDTLAVVDVASLNPKVESIPLGPKATDERRTPGRVPLPRREPLFPRLAKLLQLPSRRRARGRLELGPAQRRHRQSEKQQEPLAGAPDPAGHEHGRARDG